MCLRERSVGEAKPDIYAMLDVVNEVLPTDKPRYLMGVGFPEDLVEGVARGVDLFDCVAPTRMGRTGAFFTATGRKNIKNAQWRLDGSPLEEGCPRRLFQTPDASYQQTTVDLRGRPNSDQ